MCHLFLLFQTPEVICIVYPPLTCNWLDNLPLITSSAPNKKAKHITGYDLKRFHVVLINALLYVLLKTDDQPCVYNCVF